MEKLILFLPNICPHFFVIMSLSAEGRRQLKTEIVGKQLSTNEQDPTR